MDIEELGRIRDQEREKDSLQHLPVDFYANVGSYLEELRASRNRAAQQTADPFRDPDVKRLSDELDTAERIAEAIYERRVGKIVKLASFEAADMAAELEGLTTEEQELCDSIVSCIRDNREQVLTTFTESTGSDEVLPRGGDSSGESEESSTPIDSLPDTEEEENERTTVRITQDLGEIVGIDDQTYRLETDDIVSLPTKNAQPLLTRGAAEPVD